MRAILLLALLATVAVPAASAGPSTPVTVDPYLEVGGDCDTCFEADLTVTQTYPNCNDCPDIFAHAGVEHDGQNVIVDAVVCRGGFVTICLVEQRIVV